VSKRARKKPARSTGSRRDGQGASAVAKRPSGATQRDSAAELRLQSLLRQLDKADVTEEDAVEGPDTDFDSAGPLRGRPEDE
jgi:hypothetical protein